MDADTQIEQMIAALRKAPPAALVQRLPAVPLPPGNYAQKLPSVPLPPGNYAQDLLQRQSGGSVFTVPLQDGGRLPSPKQIDWNAWMKQITNDLPPLTKEFRKVPINAKSWEYLVNSWPVSTNVEDRRSYDPTMQPPPPLPQPRPANAPQLQLSPEQIQKIRDNLAGWEHIGRALPEPQPDQQQQPSWLGPPPAQPWPSNGNNTP